MVQAGWPCSRPAGPPFEHALGWVRLQISAPGPNPTVPQSQLVEVDFVSQKWAELYKPSPGDAIISITGHGTPEANLKRGWAACLRISFDDVDPIESPLEPGENLTEIEESQAVQIAKFVRQTASTAKVLVVHCRYGQSRSAGVAKAVAEFYGLHFPQDYEYANNFVYGLVITKLREQEAT